MKHILFQIWRWMMQPKVWRFVGFVAAVIGLLCNALSSSFNYLFGEWNLLKITLYTVFSFIICVLILFAARIWQRSRSRWFEAHTTYVVLAITSLYSYFFDKLMHITPDAYSLISCASFAVTALSLSRNKTQCGFEIDLLYFLLGCLMMQLMKIKLKLFILGAVFSYFLIILRSSFSSIDAREKKQSSEFQDGNSVVLDMDSLQPASTNTLSAINSMDSPQLVISTDIGSMIEKPETCVKELKHQNSKFIQIRLGHAKKYEHSQLVLMDPNFVSNMLNKEPIKDLEERTNVMLSAGFEKDFSEAYNNCHRESLNECLMQKIFEQKLNIEDVYNMQWKDFEHEVEKWIRASTAACNILFRHEHRLYNHIFFGFSPTSDFFFMEIPWGSNIQLLNFADYVATRAHSLDQLFKILEILEIMCDLILEFESLLYDQYNVSHNKEEVVKWKKLGETIKSISMELEYVCNTADTTTS